MKFISPAMHGVIDYLVVVFLLVSPGIFGFTGVPAAFTYVLAAVHFLLTIFTGYPVGLIKIIPAGAHATIELLVGIILIVLGYALFGNYTSAKLFYVLFGTVVMLTWLLTDYMGIFVHRI